jgi:hypothetical protein
MTLIIQKPTGAKLVLSKIQQYPAVLGEPWGGGYFAGYISHTQDGNPTHALIVAPRATGATGTSYTLTTNLQWKTATTTTTGASSEFNGRANTDAIVAAGINDHPAAKFCVDLAIGGYTDWYLPARYELDIAYFNLKPSTTQNDTTQGINAYAVPKRVANYSLLYPIQTTLPLFSGGAEAFVAGAHWTSTDVISSIAWSTNLDNASQASGNKSGISSRVRAFRRIAL